jgi:hypothetical protein
MKLGFLLITDVNDGRDSSATGSDRCLTVKLDLLSSAHGIRYIS